MPPSPLMKISPGRRDLKSDNHKRGRSLEIVISYPEKDDDLALFNEVQNKERDNFLLQSNDDFEDIFSSKLRYFSDYTHGISIPTRGESSDLLNVEGDKNDYDWLITPPETPLFASLDDEKTPASNLASRRRPRSQPISISRSSTTEKGHGSSRGSPSPHRLSPSPQSGNNNTSLQSRTRPFPATHSSPPRSSLRASSPSRKPSPPPPPSKAPLRRMSTGWSYNSVPSKTRGTSPVKTSRGNSASPKIRAWQANNIPGFSSEAPPNLRTSLADRPASYVRGSSPAGSKSGRKSMSPTASRSISSSHSNEKDPCESKGSIASFGDDDLEPLLSVPVSTVLRSINPGNKAAGSFKKPGKVLSSSAPKRSFDMALRQIERKGPQNMFRPMLSSVPSATIYEGKGSYLTSINSSITTSSNASSEQGTSGAVDIEESGGQNQEEVTSIFYKGQDKNNHDEQVFLLDHEGGEHKVEEESSVCGHNKIDGPPSDIPPIVVHGHNVSDKMSEDRDVAADLSDREICSICGRRFQLGELEKEGALQLCCECSISRAGDVEAMLTKNANGGNVLSLEDLSQEQVNSTVETGEDVDTSFNEGQQSHIAPVEEAHKTSENDMKDLQLSVNSSNSNDISEGSGISLLLKRSNSRRGHVVQSRSLTASNISYDELSYVRDSMNSMRSSVGYSSASASLSSSVDMGSSKQMEARIHRQSSGRKSDTGNYRYDTPTNADNELGEATCVDPHELSVASEYEEESESTCTDLEANGILRTAAENSVSIQPRDDLVDSNVNFEEPAVQENCETSTDKANDDTMKEDASSSGHFQGEGAVRDERICDVENLHISSLHVISEVEIENGDAETQSDVDSIDSKRCNNDSNVEDARSDPVHDIREESTVVFEDQNGQKSKSTMTLEEATDAILFCRSIVHDLAYKAADIAIKREGPATTEALRPASTYAAKSKPERREARSSRTAGKRGFKSQKAASRQRKLNTDAKPPPPVDDEINVMPRAETDTSKGDGGKPPMKLESKCNCIIM